MKMERTPRPGIELAAVARRGSAEGEQRRPGLWRDSCKCGWGRDRAQPTERIVESADSQFAGNDIFAVVVLDAGAEAGQLGLRVFDLPMAADHPALGSPGHHHHRRRLPR